MPVPIFIGRVVDGKPILQDLVRYRAWLKSLEGKEIELTIRKQRVQRSDGQRKYYFGVCVTLMAEFCGYSNTEMHEALKFRFLRMVDEHGFETTQSTRDLSVQEFTAYVEQVRQLAAEHGVVIPDPGTAE